MATRNGLYNAVWRWHFYAGLLTLPVLALLAATGGLYLFKDEVTNVVYTRLVSIEPGATAPLPASAIVDRTVAYAGESATSYLPAPAADRSARVYVTLENGDARDVFCRSLLGRGAR
jgi:uncharacterized iron-regulated membrane protein